MVLKENISSDYVYSKDELATIYARRNKFLKGEEQVLTTEEFVNYVC